MQFFDFAIYSADWALLLVRIVVGVLFLHHGIGKFVMWKMSPSEQMSGSMLVIMRLLSIVETLGALGVLLGMYTMYSALVLACVMVGALYFKIVIWKKKFSGDGGWELDLVLLSILLLLAAMGSGVFALNMLS
ncbi:MAG: DoxX family protein [Candidatus Uhrbacteria bacterium]|nr:DoxX family protein [Candidatus Uhrbacteria bacterium]